MPTLAITISDDAAAWLEGAASAEGISPESIAARLIQEASRQSSLSWEERSALRCFDAMQAGPGVPVPVRSLLSHWIRLAPGASNKAFGSAFDSLAEKGLITASDASGSAFALTREGYEAAQDA